MSLNRFWVRDPIRAYRAQLRFCLRTTVAGLLALVVARSFNFPLHGLWAVLTAVVLTQVSVGGSLQATMDYIVGTLSGAVYAAAIGVLVPHATAISQAVVLALAVAPLALAASINPSFRVAPFSAVLVLLIGGELGESPIDSAVVRVLEVALGGAVAMAVSVLVFPERAHRLGLEAAAQNVRKMADVLPKLLAGFEQSLDAAEIARMQNDLGSSVTAFQALATEAKGERIVSFRSDPDPAPLSRTLLRLRHDLVILGRAAAMPLPKGIAQRLSARMTSIGVAASEFLRESATALVELRNPPPFAPADAALMAFDSEVAALRSEGLTRALSTDEVERLFALGFALDQLFRDFADLAQRVQEYAQGEGAQAKS
ncbi:MAG: FUSC family protein [Hyphomicrobiales bacterium]|nr:FUSC family protein [Hyphomicrobiales bacterium]